MCKLYFQCNRGTAGDMIGAALMELVANKNEMMQKLNNMGIPHVEYIFEKRQKYGIDGNAMTVKIHGDTEEHIHEADHHAHEEEHVHCETDHHHDHTHEVHHRHGQEHHHHQHMTMDDIHQIVNGMNVSGKVKRDIMETYEIIADAESLAHNCPVSEVHFHEVGAMDAIADVAAVCQILEELAPSEIAASEVHVGNGTVKCAHGILPVPAPATANILKDIPYENGEINGEICTPTGAALLKHFVDKFVPEEPETDKKNGIGIGKRTFATPSYFRACMM